MSKTVQMETSAGTLRIELDEVKAPLSCANFLAYVDSGHFDGTVFHRVIKGFMLQGGGFDSSMKQKATLAAVRNEANNGLKNKHYTLAMARTSDPHSATAQFFINVKDNVFLDPSAQQPGYTVFGKVTSGMEVIQKIKVTPTGAAGPFPSDVPKTPILINSATLVK